ncbi:hypothetical protein QTP88_022050 [Uroleucon formosanum]
MIFKRVHARHRRKTTGRKRIQTAFCMERGIGSWSAGVAAPSKTNPRESRRENSVVTPPPPCHVRSQQSSAVPSLSLCHPRCGRQSDLGKRFSRTDSSPTTKYGRAWAVTTDEQRSPGRGDRPSCRTAKYSPTARTSGRFDGDDAESAICARIPFNRTIVPPDDVA